MHIDVSGAEKGKVAVSHIESEVWEVGVSFRKVACVGMSKNVLHPMPLKSRFIPNLFPLFRLVLGREKLGLSFKQNILQLRANLDMPNAARLGAQALPIQSHLSDFFPLLVDTNFYRHLANLLLTKKR